MDAELISVLETLWRVPPPGPENLFSAPGFVSLADICEARYGSGKAKFALSTALRSLGLPCLFPAEMLGQAVEPRIAAEAIDRAFARRTTLRRHMCPLDLADKLPQLMFGRARVGSFSAAELEAMFDAPRLARNFPDKPLETRRFAQFQWLVVEEEVNVDPRPEARSIPALFMDMSRDIGEIEPHLGRFPPAVEAALFFLLLAPWEQWSTMPEVDWRGFRVPWIYTVDDDLLVRPDPTPSVDSLTLEPWIVEDGSGQEIELERPTTLPLGGAAEVGLVRFTDIAWNELQAAQATTLFETPIVHFLVRAFLADGMDEVMAHMTAIEAALGLEMDHKKWMRQKPDPHRKVSPRDRVAARIAALLNDTARARCYIDLFELRSGFVHGRAGLQRVSTPSRVSARSLASDVARALVNMAVQPVGTRAVVLNNLLDKGVRSL
ncbi:hypothetical protein SAMN05444158_4836 [Bradyrhizobium canariense]|uniref:Apea-like HEPN domain-containing protein n=1 Tax=Bradyrhizobium canariense TaxID=255045 RepID=A0A1H1YJT8_9BRAD|nr:hypothetical protein SAMN05444158_4836 [Bradyrhizobium canariense]